MWKIFWSFWDARWEFWTGTNLELVENILDDPDFENQVRESFKKEKLQ